MVWKRFFELFVRFLTNFFCYLAIYIDHMLNVDDLNDFYTNKLLHEIPKGY